MPRLLLGGGAAIALMVAVLTLIPAPEPEPVDADAETLAAVPAGDASAGDPAADARAADADEVAATDADAAAVVPAPRFSDVRIEPGGVSLVSGLAAPGTQVRVLLDDIALAEVDVGETGMFIEYVDIAPSEIARRLSLVADPDGAAVASPDSILVAPTVAPPPLDLALADDNSADALGPVTGADSIALADAPGSPAGPSEDGIAEHAGDEGDDPAGEEVAVTDLADAGTAPEETAPVGPAPDDTPPAATAEAGAGPEEPAADALPIDDAAPDAVAALESDPTELPTESAGEQTDAAQVEPTGPGDGTDAPSELALADPAGTGTAAGPGIDEEANAGAGAGTDTDGGGNPTDDVVASGPAETGTLPDAAGETAEVAVETAEGAPDPATDELETATADSGPAEPAQPDGDEIASAVAVDAGTGVEPAAAGDDPEVATAGATGPEDAGTGADPDVEAGDTEMAATAGPAPDVAETGVEPPEVADGADVATAGAGPDDAGTGALGLDGPEEDPPASAVAAVEGGPAAGEEGGAAQAPDQLAATGDIAARADDGAAADGEPAAGEGGNGADPETASAPETVPADADNASAEAEAEGEAPGDALVRLGQEVAPTTSEAPSGGMLSGDDVAVLPEPGEDAAGDGGAEPVAPELADATEPQPADAPALALAEPAETADPGPVPQALTEPASVPEPDLAEAGTEPAAPPDPEPPAVSVEIASAAPPPEGGSAPTVATTAEAAAATAPPGDLDTPAPAVADRPDPAASGTPPAALADAPAPPAVPEDGGAPAQAPLLMAGEEGVRLLQPALAPGAGPDVLDTVALDTITYDDGGEVLVSGRAVGGGAVRVYVDNALVLEAPVGAGGDWAGRVDPELPAGTYTMRVDQIGADGEVVSRIESPFLREERQTIAAALQVAAGGVAVRTIQPGNTLWGIAEERYGDGFMYVAVFEANRDRIRNPNLIYPGQVFRIPEPAGE
ncbi:LysM peptidoglycan-binding domain-containing protein [Wenxinia marina]|uniref:LysM peptidoglycan-binding domain-containing protein n=1 Tax=Wenxinia marina TaxID=390641 RepID=UPI0003772267|nr:LysM peptidoglycan-binding domain-containing protein [Wenxinia marina]